MGLKETVRDTFFSIIYSYDAELIAINENNVSLAADKFVIEISWHFGEVFVSLKQSEKEVGIEPLLWAYFTGQLDYKEVLPTNYPPEMLLGEIVKYELAKECAYICIFCKRLLEGDFSQKEEFFKKKNSILKELNSYFHNRSKN